MEYLIWLAIFIGGNVTGAISTHNSEVREMRRYGKMEAERAELVLQMADPTKDEKARIKLDKKLRALDKKMAKLNRRYDTMGTKALAMEVGQGAR